MEQGGRDERGDIGDQEAHIRQLEAEDREPRRANEILQNHVGALGRVSCGSGNRCLVVRGLNELRVADIPCVRAQVSWVCASFITNVHSRRPHPPRRAGVFPSRGGIDNVYGPAGRIHSPTTAGPDAKRREPGSKLLPSRREPAHRAPRHRTSSTEPSAIQRPTTILTDNHNGYTQTVTRVLR